MVSAHSLLIESVLALRASLGYPEFGIVEGHHQNMRIAIYNTNPKAMNADPSNDHYGQMFEGMLHPEMPGATFEHFDVVDGVFPENPTEFNAIVCY